MEELLRERFLAHYYQIALADYQGPEAYPQWITGEEEAILGPKGVAVATPTDSYIETIVFRGEEIIDGIELISGVIEVGNAGLFVGNETSASYKILPWPSGKASIKAYLVKPEGIDVQVVFVLNDVAPCKKEEVPN